MVPGFPQLIQSAYTVSPNPSLPVSLVYGLDAGYAVISACFTLSGDAFAFAGCSDVFLVATADSHLIRTFPVPAARPGTEFYVRSVKISADSRYLAFDGPNSDILVYFLDNGSLLSRFKGHSQQVSSLLFSADSTILFSAGFDGHLCCWDLASLTLQRKEYLLHEPTELIRSLAGIDDGALLAVGFSTGVVGICEASLTHPMTSFSAHQGVAVMQVATSLLDGTIATSGHDKVAKIWSLRGAASLKQTLFGHEDFVMTVAFSPTEPILFTGSKDETVMAWDYKHGNMLFTLRGHANTVFAVVHHPSERMFVSCSGDQTICLWKY
jgi:WD40 repeat protein